MKTPLPQLTNRKDAKIALQNAGVCLFVYNGLYPESAQLNLECDAMEISAMFEERYILTIYLQEKNSS